MYEWPLGAGSPDCRWRRQGGAWEKGRVAHARACGVTGSARPRAAVAERAAHLRHDRDHRPQVQLDVPAAPHVALAQLQVGLLQRPRGPPSWQH